MAKRKVSVGKYRALQRASMPYGLFIILAIDHQHAIRNVLNPKAVHEVSDDEIVQIKLEMLQTMGRACSSVVLDPKYSAAQAIRNNVGNPNGISKIGLLVGLENTDYEEPSPRVVNLRPNWSVAKIKRMGADGVKLSFYYNPDDKETAQQQEAIVSKVVEQCGVYDIPFYAEPVIYPFHNSSESEAYAESLIRLVVETAKRIAELGADVLILEIPIDINHNPDEHDWLSACSSVSSITDCPWVLSSAEIDYAIFRMKIEVAIRGGASGFMAGRTIWREAGHVESDFGRSKWLAMVGTPRMQELTNEILSRVHPSDWRRWHDIIKCESVSTEWYSSYEGEQ